MIQRMRETVEAVCPIVPYSVYIGEIGNSATVTFTPAGNATAQQITAANTAITNFDWSLAAQDAWEKSYAKARAKAMLTAGLNQFKMGDGVLALIVRALALAILDEFNEVRGWIASFKAEVAQATSLANLQSRVAGLPNMPQRNISNVITAVSNKIDGGNAD